jgi:hypothetical protein
MTEKSKHVSKTGKTRQKVVAKETQDELKMVKVIIQLCPLK